MTVDEYAWPLAELGEAIAEMGRRTGLAVMAAALPGSPPSRCATDPSALADWLDQTAAGLGLETEAVETSYTRIETLLHHSPPALLRLPTSDAAAQSAGGLFLTLLGRTSNWQMRTSPTAGCCGRRRAQGSGIRFARAICWVRWAWLSPPIFSISYFCSFPGR